MRVITLLALSGLTALFTGCSDSSSDSDSAQGGDNGQGGSPSQGGNGAGAPSGESAELNGITAAHNEARANVNPAAATPLTPLTWDPALASVAQAYAENCVFEHSGGPYGENLYANTGLTQPATIVEGWVSEVADYDYASNSCDGGAICGHYTQVVWADSTKLGCGVATCSQNSPFGSGQDWQNWVCNYDPPGNWVGEQPY